MGWYGGSVVAPVGLPVATAGAPHTLVDTGTAPSTYLAHISAVPAVLDPSVVAAAVLRELRGRTSSNSEFPLYC